MAKKDVIIPLVPAALSALLLAVTVFSACEQRPDGSWMHCHQCQNMVAGSAVGLIALYGASSLVKNKPARLALLALAVIASVVVFFIPGGICPLCAMKTMRCHTVFHHERPGRRQRHRGAGRVMEEGREALRLTYCPGWETMAA